MEHHLITSLLSVVVLTAASAQVDPLPNIVILFADDVSSGAVDGAWG